MAIILLMLVFIFCPLRQLQEFVNGAASNFFNREFSFFFQKHWELKILKNFAMKEGKKSLNTPPPFLAIRLNLVTKRIYFFRKIAVSIVRILLNLTFSCKIQQNMSELWTLVPIKSHCVSNKIPVLTHIMTICQLTYVIHSIHLLTHEGIWNKISLKNIFHIC